MLEPVMLKVKDDDVFCICNKCWYSEYLKENKCKSDIKKLYVVDDKLIATMEDLIQYCFSNNIDIELPTEYQVDAIYNITFTTADFEPEDKSISNCKSTVIYSGTDYRYTLSKFKTMCKHINRKTSRISKHHFCWHTEDYASNQIIHSYDISESYKVTKCITKYAK